MPCFSAAAKVNSKRLRISWEEAHDVNGALASRSNAKLCYLASNRIVGFATFFPHSGIHEDDLNLKARLGTRDDEIYRNTRTASELDLSGVAGRELPA